MTAAPKESLRHAGLATAAEMELAGTIQLFKAASMRATPELAEQLREKARAHLEALLDCTAAQMAALMREHGFG